MKTKIKGKLKYVNIMADPAGFGDINFYKNQAGHQLLIVALDEPDIKRIKQVTVIYE